MSEADSRAPVSVDHVWANGRVFLPGGRVPAACQLGGDGLGPHLAELADLAVVVGTHPRPGRGWTAVTAPADRAPFADRSFDLVAVEDLGATGRPAERVLEEARRLCRPTGSVLLGFRAGPLARLRRQGSRLGDPVLVALPGARRPAFLLQPDHQEAVGYFLGRVAFAYRKPRASGVGASLQQAASRLALAAPARLAIRAAPGRLAVDRGPAAPRSLLEGVRALVGDCWSQLELPGTPPGRLATLVVGHRRPTTGMVTALLFRPGDAAPAVVAKLPRYGATGAPLRREASALDAVWRALRGPVRDAIPRPLGLHRIDGTEVLLQTGVPGSHLVATTASGRLHPAAVARQLDLALAWCLAMQAASGRSVVVDDALIAARIEPLASAVLAVLDGDRLVASLLDRTVAEARRLRGTRLPLVVCHGDYWAGNIFIHDGRVCGVVDWERAAVDDLPLWDPVKAVGSAAYHLDRYRSLPRRGQGALPHWGDLGAWTGIADPQFAAGFRAAFVQRGWLAELSRGALVEAFGRAGVPLDWLAVAIRMYLMRQVLDAEDSPRSVAGWGSVLRALAAAPATWADELGAGRRITMEASRG
jgi:aminoglycoside phosphotransferase